MTLFYLFKCSDHDLQNWKLIKKGLTEDEVHYESNNYSYCGCYTQAVPCLEECETKFFFSEDALKDLEEVDCPVCYVHILTEKDTSIPCPVCFEAEQYKEMHKHYPWRYEERLQRSRAEDFTKVLDAVYNIGTQIGKDNRANIPKELYPAWDKYYEYAEKYDNDFDTIVRVARLDNLFDENSYFYKEVWLKKIQEENRRNIMINNPENLLLEGGC